MFSQKNEQKFLLYSQIEYKKFPTPYSAEGDFHPRIETPSSIWTHPNGFSPKYRRSSNANSSPLSLSTIPSSSSISSQAGYQLSRVFITGGQKGWIKPTPPSNLSANSSCQNAAVEEAQMEARASAHLILNQEGILPLDFHD